LVLKLEFIDHFINFFLLFILPENPLKVTFLSFMSFLQIIPVLINESVEGAQLYPDMREIYLQHMIND